MSSIFRQGVSELSHVEKLLGSQLCQPKHRSKSGITSMLKFVAQTVVSGSHAKICVEIVFGKQI